jgi:hypothetical protein
MSPPDASPSDLPPDDVDRPDSFRVEGSPIHTRALEIDVSQADDGRLRATGVILDLRKFGFVPTGGELQVSGFIHHMSLDARIDPSTSILESIEPAQAVVAFEAGPRTGGESCRDSIGRLRGLAGTRLDEAFSKTLAATYGGALGCSHLLTLAHLLAATVPKAIAWENDARALRPAVRERGERILKRSLVLDGFDLDGGARLDVAMQLNDVFTAPFSLVGRPLERFARQHEVRVLARVDMADATLASIRAQERERAGTPIAAGGWRSRDAVLAPLVGGPAIYGLGRSVREHLGAGPAHATLRDTLQHFAPGLIQCLAAFAHRMVESGGAIGEEPSILQLGGLPDSCYIWREGGPGMRMREEAQRAGGMSDPTTATANAEEGEDR